MSDQFIHVEVAELAEFYCLFGFFLSCFVCINGVSLVSDLDVFRIGISEFLWRI